MQWLYYDRDCHCGYKHGEERWTDSFIALNEAIVKTSDCDLIIIAGDLFDTRVPRPEVFAKTAKILSKTQTIPSGTKFLEKINKEKLVLKRKTQSLRRSSRLAKKMARCPKGTRRNKKSGNCEKKSEKVRKRCPNGTRRNKKTNKCE